MSVTFPYNRGYEPSMPVAEITVRGERPIELTALIDTGADASILPLPILRSIGARFLEIHQVRDAMGRALPVSLYLVTVEIAGHRMYGIEAIAAETSDEIIIGRDVLNHLIVTFDGIGGETEIS